MAKYMSKGNSQDTGGNRVATLAREREPLTYMHP